MLQSIGDPDLNIFEISGLAWAVAVDRALRALAAEPEIDFAAYQQSSTALALGSLEPADTRRLDAELREAGIVGPDGTMPEQWLLAVLIAVSAPIRVTVVARTGEHSAHTHLGLAGGHGIAVSYRRRIRTTDAGTAVTGIQDVVEVALFEERHAWSAVRRILPGFTELQAGPGSARGLDSDRGLDGARTPVSPQQLQAVGSAELQQDVKDAVLAPRCTVHLDVVAAPPGTAPAFRAADLWHLSEKLYSVRTSGDDGGRSLVMVDVPPGDVARELFWRLLGAREFLAGSAGQAAQR
ncbi:hypothetical protein [Arthrobacter sp. YAF16]|uniref:hypothetical protein n=1 Tax=Arthrobacter sp. YAF16 TaxID=3233076 RepID=UPI003F8FAF8E